MLKLNNNPAVQVVYNNYPKAYQSKILALRELIIETANEAETINELEETLKWGEPSFLTKGGSTLRIAWSGKRPNQYGIYFKCTSLLVPTFKTVFSDIFRFEDKRAIIFSLNDHIPKAELKSCIKAALCYHQVKHLPTLGI